MALVNPRNGIDVSYYDGGGGPDFKPLLETVKWDEYRKNGWGYAFIKISQGSFVDPLFRKQWSAARGHTYRGGYHFFSPLVDFIKSVDNTVSFFDGDFGELPPVFDLEVTDGVSDTATRALKWLGRFRNQTGIVPIIYSSVGFLNQIKAHLYLDFSAYPLWIAQYPYENLSDSVRAQIIKDTLYERKALSFPTPPAPFKRVSFFQWTGRGNPEDVAGYYTGYGSKLAIDFNVYNGTYEEMIQEFKLPVLTDPEEPTEPAPGGDMKVGTLNQALNYRDGFGTVGTNVKGTLKGGDKVVGTIDTARSWFVVDHFIVNGIKQVPSQQVYCSAWSGYYSSISDYVAPVPEKTLTHTIKVYDDGSITVDA
jgi:GH25 family lysozyme M1 (1,4-beta-N-acetylmuramidase)